MPAGSNEDDASKKDTSQDHRHQQQTIWPEDQSMDAQQDAANQLFRRNSEELQKRQEAKRETPKPRQTLTFAKDQDRGNYAQLKQAHATETDRKAQTQDRPNQQPAGPSQEQGKKQRQTLHFAKDAPQLDRAALKQEHAEQVRQEEKGRQPEGQRQSLQFAKDRGGMDLGRG